MGNGLKGESLIIELVESVDSRLGGLPLKSMFLGELFSNSRNWLTPAEVTPPASARPQMSRFRT